MPGGDKVSVPHLDGAVYNMTPEPRKDIFKTDDDLKTAVPNMKPDEWKMPDPVFRKTSGRLPESFVQKHPPVIEPEVDVQSSSLPQPKPKSPALKMVIVALALTAMIAFIAVFLTVVYFMFLR